MATLMEIRKWEFNSPISGNDAAIAIRQITPKESTVILAEHGKQFFIVVNVDTDNVGESEELEDAVATLLGGLGYTGHLQSELTMNEVHFPVMNRQPIVLLEKATSMAHKFAQDWLEAGEMDEDDAESWGGSENDDEDMMTQEEADENMLFLTGYVHKNGIKVEPAKEEPHYEPLDSGAVEI